MGEEFPGGKVAHWARGNGEQADLRSASPALYPPVSSVLLRIHASLCQVLHACGAGEVIDRILRDWEEFRVLGEDGTDAQLLTDRLSLIAAF